MWETTESCKLDLKNFPRSSTMSPFFPSKKPQPASHLLSPHSLSHPSQPPTYIPRCDGCFPRPHMLSFDQASVPRKCQAAEGTGSDRLSCFLSGSSCGVLFPLRPHLRSLALVCKTSPPTIRSSRSLAKDLVPLPFIWASSLGVPPLFSSGQLRFWYLMAHVGREGQGLFV